LTVVTGPIYDGSNRLVEVSPLTTTVLKLPSNGTTYQQQFTLRNDADSADSYDLLTRRLPGTALTTVSITGSGVTQGANPDSARLANVAANATATVTVTYNVGSGAAGPSDTLVFTARSVPAPTKAGSGRLTLTVVRPSLTVGKAVSPTGTLPPGTVLSDTLTITNGGTSHAAGVALVDTLATAVQFKVGSVATTLP